MLARAVPAPAGVGPGYHQPPPAHPHQWASDPPRSPLDLLASLPQISDMFSAPHSSHPQGQHGHSPVVTPRTQNWFEAHFPDLGSSTPSSSHHQQQPQQYQQYQQYQLPTPVSDKPTPAAASSNTINLRFPMDAGLGSAGYWMPSGGGEQASEREGGIEEVDHGREPLRLRHFGPL